MTGSRRSFSEVVADMQWWCKDNGQYAFTALCRHARENNEEWFRVLTSNAGTRVMSDWCRYHSSTK